VSDFSSCIWCNRPYPPATVSREHVLPEFLGVYLKLPDGAVCKECNNSLNTQLDQPLKAILQPIITFFGVQSCKRDSAASARVHIATERGAITAQMLPGGLLTHPDRVRRARVQDGREVLEEWLVRSDHLEDFLAERRQKMDIIDHELAVTQLCGAHAQLQGKAGILIRSAVRAGINLVALKAAKLLARPELCEARRYVLDDTNALPERRAEASGPLIKGRFDASECRLEHAILFSAESGGPAVVELRLFGDIFCRVFIVNAWGGSPVAIEKTFAVDGSTTSAPPPTR
jgi:HNH endonuclease